METLDGFPFEYIQIQPIEGSKFIVKELRIKDLHKNLCKKSSWCYRLVKHPNSAETSEVHKEGQELVNNEDERDVPKAGSTHLSSSRFREVEYTESHPEFLQSEVPPISGSHRKVPVTGQKTFKKKSFIHAALKKKTRLPSSMLGDVDHQKSHPQFGDEDSPHSSIEGAFQGGELTAANNARFPSKSTVVEHCDIEVEILNVEEISSDPDVATPANASNRLPRFPRRSRASVSYSEVDAKFDPELRDGINTSGSAEKWSYKSPHSPSSVEEKRTVEKRSVTVKGKQKWGHNLPSARKVKQSIPMKSNFQVVKAREDGDSEVELSVEDHGDIKHPSFSCEMKSTNVITCFWMSVPAFFRQNMPLNGDSIVILEDEKGLKWETKYLARRGGFSGGWRRFTIDHGLEPGDVLVFELVKPLKFKVHIMKASGGGKPSGKPSRDFERQRTSSSDDVHIMKASGGGKPSGKPSRDFERQRTSSSDDVGRTHAAIAACISSKKRVDRGDFHEVKFSRKKPRPSPASVFVSQDKKLAKEVEENRLFSTTLGGRRGDLSGSQTWTAGLKSKDHTVDNIVKDHRGNLAIVLFNKEAGKLKRVPRSEDAPNVSLGKPMEVLDDKGTRIRESHKGLLKVFARKSSSLSNREQQRNGRTYSRGKTSMKEFKKTATVDYIGKSCDTNETSALKTGCPSTSKESHPGGEEDLMCKENLKCSPVSVENLTFTTNVDEDYKSSSDTTHYEATLVRKRSDIEISDKEREQCLEEDPLPSRRRGSSFKEGAETKDSESPHPPDGMRMRYARRAKTKCKLVGNIEPLLQGGGNAPREEKDTPIKDKLVEVRNESYESQSGGGASDSDSEGNGIPRHMGAEESEEEDEDSEPELVKGVTFADIVREERETGVLSSVKGKHSYASLRDRSSRRMIRGSNSKPKPVREPNKVSKAKAKSSETKLSKKAASIKVALSKKIKLRSSEKPVLRSKERVISEPSESRGTSSDAPSATPVPDTEAELDECTQPRKPLLIPRPPSALRSRNPQIGLAYMSKTGRPKREDNRRQRSGWRSK